MIGSTLHGTVCSEPTPSTKGLTAHPSPLWWYTPMNIKRLLRFLGLAGALLVVTGCPRAGDKQGPKDAKGRSLRELDLKTRLQKYPLSYMIHSPAFRALPDAPKNLVMGKINRVLSGEIKDAKYAHLTPALRTAIREILQSTVERP